MPVPRLLERNTVASPEKLLIAIFALKNHQSQGWNWTVSHTLPQSLFCFCFRLQAKWPCAVLFIPHPFGLLKPVGKNPHINRLVVFKACENSSDLKFRNYLYFGKTIVFWDLQSWKDALKFYSVMYTTILQRLWKEKSETSQEDFQESFQIFHLSGLRSTVVNQNFFKENIQLLENLP